MNRFIIHYLQMKDLEIFVESLLKARFMKIFKYISSQQDQDHLSLVWNSINAFMIPTFSQESFSLLHYIFTLFWRWFTQISPSQLLPPLFFLEFLFFLRRKRRLGTIIPPPLLHESSLEIIFERGIKGLLFNIHQIVSHRHGYFLTEVAPPCCPLCGTLENDIITPFTSAECTCRQYFCYYCLQTRLAVRKEGVLCPCCKKDFSHIVHI